MDFLAYLGARPYKANPFYARVFPFPGTDPEGTAAFPGDVLSELNRRGQPDRGVQHWLEAADPESLYGLLRGGKGALSGAV